MIIFSPLGLLYGFLIHFRSVQAYPVRGYIRTTLNWISQLSWDIGGYILGSSPVYGKSNKQRPTTIYAYIHAQCQLAEHVFRQWEETEYPEWNYAIFQICTDLKCWMMLVRNPSDVMLYNNTRRTPLPQSNYLAKCVLYRRFLQVRVSSFGLRMLAQITTGKKRKNSPSNLCSASVASVFYTLHQLILAFIRVVFPQGVFSLDGARA